MSASSAATVPSVRRAAAPRTASRWPLVLALLVYAGLTLSASWRFRDQLNPDAVCYLRGARAVAAGRLADSVSVYWSPLLSWSAAPLIVAGTGAIPALRLVLAVSGGLLVVFTRRLLRRFVALPPVAEAACLLVVADATVRWAVALFPDLLLATAMMACLGFLADPALASRRRPAVLAGVAGGVGFLAKAYAMPYFVVLLPFTAALTAFSDESAGAPRPGLDSAVTASAGTAAGGRRSAIFGRVCLRGLAGFLAVALPWIAVLSWKSGGPTWGVAGAINHAVVGPGDVPREHPNVERLWTPEPSRITIWETPERMTYHPWSPFESAAYFRHQVGIAWRTCRQIRAAVSAYDLFGLSLALLVLAPVLFLALGRAREFRGACRLSGAAWIFALGFTPVYFSYRYVDPLLKPLSAILVFGIAATLSGEIAARTAWGLRSVRPAALALWAIVCLSFAAQANLPFVPFLSDDPDATPFSNVVTDTALHRDIAARLRAEGLHGPLACTRYWGGLYVAYYLDEPFLGAPEGGTVEAAATTLRDHGARLFLVDGRWKLAAEFASESGALGWTRREAIDAGAGETLTVYSRTPGSDGGGAEPAGGR